MTSILKIIGVFLILVAAIVAINTVVEPLYHTSATEEGASPYNDPVWKYINILSAISIVLGIILSYSRMSKVNENSSVQEFIAANTLFYGFMFVAVFFFWNWFGIINPGRDYTPTQTDTASMVWMIVDAALPLLNGALGVHLLRNSDSG